VFVGGAIFSDSFVLQQYAVTPGFNSLNVACIQGSTGIGWCGLPGTGSRAGLPRTSPQAKGSCISVGSIHQSTLISSSPTSSEDRQTSGPCSGSSLRKNSGTSSFGTVPPSFGGGAWSTSFKAQAWISFRFDPRVIFVINRSIAASARTESETAWTGCIFPGADTCAVLSPWLRDLSLSEQPAKKIGPTTVANPNDPHKIVQSHQRLCRFDTPIVVRPATAPAMRLALFICTCTSREFPHRIWA
jgi:hypothetical protein